MRHLSSVGRFALLFLVAVGLLFACRSVPISTLGIAPTGRYAEARRQVEALIRDEMRKSNLIGLAIGLVDDQEVVWAQGFGFADKELGTPVTPETVFTAASVSKLFTATAVMKLAEEGRVELDEPLSRYFAEFAVKSRYPGARPIEVRDLLTHHSGLPADLLVLRDRTSRGRDLWFAEMARLLADEYVVSPPGTMFSYSNLGYNLLGSVVERVSGRPFESYMSEEVLEPLGMLGASFAAEPRLQAQAAKGYRHGIAGADSFSDGSPSAGLRGSVLDLCAFIKMIHAEGATPGGRFLGSESVREMLRQQNAGVEMDLGFRIGLGFWLQDVGGYAAAGHAGDSRRFHSSLLTVPGQKLGVYVASNSAESAPVVARVARRALELALEARTGIAAPAAAPAAREGVKIDPADLERLPGFYATELGLITATSRRGELWSRLQGNDLKLVPRPDHRFSMRFYLFGLLPIRVPSLDTLELSFPRIGGKDLVTAYVAGNAVVLGERISPAPIPDSWSARIGSWRQVNTDGVGDILESVVLRRDGEFLVFETTRSEVGVSARPLTPLSDKEALTAGTGRSMGETIRVKTVGGEERLMFSGYELVRVGP